MKVIFFLLILFTYGCLEEDESIKISKVKESNESSDTSSPGNSCTETAVASQICNGVNVLNVTGSSYCITASGTGSIAISSQICSGFYAFGNSGELIQGSRNCSYSELTNPSNGFSPKSISSIVGWYAADNVSGEGVDLPENSSAIDVWMDLSGNNRNFFASSSTTAPTFQTTNTDISNKPTLNFDGSNDGMSFPFKGKDILNNVSGATVVAVYKANTTTSYGTLLNISAGTQNIGRLWFSRNYGTNGEYFVGGRRLDSNSFSSLSTGTNHGTNFQIATLALDYQNAGLKLYLNSALEGQKVDGSFQTPGNSSATDSVVVKLGNSGQGGDYFNTNVAEVLIFNEDLSETNSQTDIECYLAQKYNITLTGTNCP